MFSWREAASQDSGEAGGCGTLALPRPGCARRAGSSSLSLGVLLCKCCLVLGGAKGNSRGHLPSPGLHSILGRTAINSP